jgi:hypothetical protein
MLALTRGGQSWLANPLVNGGRRELFLGFPPSIKMSTRRIFRTTWEPCAVVAVKTFGEWHF